MIIKISKKEWDSAGKIKKTAMSLPEIEYKRIDRRLKGFVKEFKVKTTDTYEAKGYYTLEIPKSFLEDYDNGKITPKQILYGYFSIGKVISAGMGIEYQENVEDIKEQNGNINVKVSWQIIKESEMM